MSLNLDLNGGGSYYIQGITPDIIIDCGDNYAFQISNVKLCNIQNLKINATGISVSDRKIIHVSDRVLMEIFKVRKFVKLEICNFSITTLIFDSNSSN